MKHDSSPALMTARSFLRDLVTSAISEGCVRIHIKDTGMVLREAPGIHDPAIYPEKHKTTDMRQKMNMFRVTFADYLEVIAQGAGFQSAEQASGYITWESSLGALGDKSCMSGRPVNWFYRPATRTAPAALIAGIATPEAAQTATDADLHAEAA